MTTPPPDKRPKPAKPAKVARPAKLTQTLASLPTQPGVYLHKDARGKILYVGKAKNLRNRVRSYFQKKSELEAKIRIMVAKVADVETIVTRNEVEALLLESNFIKQYKPPYNVVLRDDKHYLFIKVSVQEEFPRVTTVRRVADDKAKYFGPYTSANAVRASLKTLRKAFPYCVPHDGCDDKSRRRPCLYYNLGLCPSPQYGHISPFAYRANISQIIRFLEGQTAAVTGAVRQQMEAAAAEERFETAARLRDRLRKLESLTSDQQAVDTKRGSRDAVGLARDASHAVVTLLMVRDGRILARNQFDFWGTGESSDAEIIDSFLGQYYKVATDVPDEVLVPIDSSGLANARLVGTYLTERRRVTDRRSRKVQVQRPQRGEKHRLLELATANAANYLQQLRSAWLADQERTEGAVEELAEQLKLPKLPLRIECYDISTLSGTSTVGSMVVFQSGAPAKAHYRRFRIQHVQGIDDFAAMREVLRRRFRKLAQNRGAGNADGADATVTDPNFGTLPDLVIIDGGKGQVSAASTIMAELGLTDVPLIGLAKRLEEIVTQDVASKQFSVAVLPQDSYALYLLQRIRDEAHRFAITYNRQMRSKQSIRSALDTLPGIGPVKKKQLMRKFGSVSRIREAGLTEIQAVVGSAAGKVVKDNL